VKIGRVSRCDDGRVRVLGGNNWGKVGILALTAKKKLPSPKKRALRSPKLFPIPDRSYMKLRNGYPDQDQQDAYELQ